MCMGVLPEEAALGMDGPEGLARVGVSGEAQGKSGRGGKGVWALGMPAHAQVLEARVRWLSFMLQAWAVTVFQRHRVCEALSALPRNGSCVSKAFQRVP